MKFTLIMLIFSATAVAQSSLDKETYKSKKNAFVNKYSEVNDAYKSYWSTKKEVQKFDAVILLKEKSIINSKVQLENVERALATEKDLKKTLDEKSELNKETVFVKSGKGYITADVNDPEHFKAPKEGDKKICLADQSRCFPFKVEDGKKVLVLTKQEVMIEYQNLKGAKSSYKDALAEQELQRDRLIQNRTLVSTKEKFAEKKLDEKKTSLSEFVISANSGINEEFIDQLVKEPGKEKLFGSAEVDAGAESTKDQMMTALEKNVFAKDSYGLLLDKADEYLKADKQYDNLVKNVEEMKGKYSVSAPSLAVVEKSKFVFPDPLFVKRFPAEAQKNSVATMEYFQKQGYPVEIVGKITEGRIPASDLEDQPLAVKKDQLCKLGDEDCSNSEANVVKEEVCKEGEENCSSSTATPVVKKEEQACKEGDEGCSNSQENVGKEGEGVCKEGDEDCAIPTSDKSSAEEETPEALCRKEAVTKLLELFKDDKQNILGKQFNLTAMKTALYLKSKVAEGSVPASMEQIINKEQANIAKDEKIAELKKLYKDNGLNKAADGMDEVVSKMKKGEFNYYASKSRMTNDDASKLYMLLSKSDSDIKFGMEDAAIAWAFGQMNKFEKGTSQYNKLNLSTQVNRLMAPTIAGGTNMSSEDLDKASKAAEKEINDAVDVSLKSISSACQNMLSENCLIASDLKHDAFAEMMKTIISKQELKMDDKQLDGFHMEVKSFIGKPGEQDFIEIGKMRLRKNIPTFKEEDLKNVQIAAGKTVISRKDQEVKAEGKCYQTKYDNGAVNVSEIQCK